MASTESTTTNRRNGSVGPSPPSLGSMFGRFRMTPSRKTRFTLARVSSIDAMSRRPRNSEEIDGRITSDSASASRP
jgi:hypothetical protein